MSADFIKVFWVRSKIFMLKIKYILLTFLFLISLNQLVAAQEQSASDAQKSITKDVQVGKAISLPTPKFPPTAKALGISGQVNVLVVVDENGDVISASAKTGHSLLVPAAIEAAKIAKFTPAILNGEKVKFKGTVAYNFVRNPNWEKIGFNLGFIEREVMAVGSDVAEIEFVSKQLQDLREELIKISRQQDIKEKAKLAAKIINPIYQKLAIQEPAGAWHFRLGVLRSRLSTKTGEEGSFKENLPKIKELFDFAPSDLPTERLDDLVKVIEFSNKPNLTSKDRYEIIRLLTESYNRMVNLP